MKINIKFDQIVEKIEIHILCSITFSENRAVYEKMWTNIVVRRRLQTTIWPCTLHAGYPRLQSHTQVV